MFQEGRKWSSPKEAVANSSCRYLRKFIANSNENMHADDRV